jgi:enamine deaminase RidA (YjgF/YER057c/UK114 family)
LGEQAKQALRNVKTAVEAAGGNLADIVSLRIYIVHRGQQNLDAVGRALRNTFATNPPTSSWIGVASLAVPEFLIEIEATAVLE